MVSPNANRVEKPLLVTVPAALRLLSIGRTTFYKMISAGQVEVVKIGARTLVRYSSIEALTKAPHAQAA